MSSRHRSFRTTPASTPPSTELTHSDACLDNVRRFGFCDHTQLPRPRRARHPVRREILASLGLGILVLCDVVLGKRLGWLGIGLGCGVGLGWLMLFLFGLPKWFTADISKTLPPDARERLDAS